MKLKLKSVLIIFAILVLIAVLFFQPIKLESAWWVESQKHYTVGTSIDSFTFKQTVDGHHSYVEVYRPLETSYYERFTWFDDDGTTVVPVDVYLNKIGMWKVEFDTGAVVSTDFFYVDAIYSDIRLDSFEISPTLAKEGDLITVSFSIKNYESLVSGKIGVSVFNDYANTGEPQGPNDEWESVINVPLNAGQTYTDSLTFTIRPYDVSVMTNEQIKVGIKAWFKADSVPQGYQLEWYETVSINLQGIISYYTGAGTYNLIVNTVPAECFVELDGVLKSSSGGVIIFSELSSGNYELKVYLEGYKTSIQTVEILGGDKTIDVALEEEDKIPGFESTVFLISIIISFWILKRGKKNGH